jgi:hypothetical protein
MKTPAVWAPQNWNDAWPWRVNNLTSKSVKDGVALKRAPGLS